MREKSQKISFVIKPTGGKLLQVKLTIKDNLIKSCSLSGDFFIYPEEALEQLENFLKEKSITNLEEKIISFLKDHKITILGWAPKDFSKALLENIN